MLSFSLETLGVFDHVPVPRGPRRIRCQRPRSHRRPHVLRLLHRPRAPLAGADAEDVATEGSHACLAKPVRCILRQDLREGGDKRTLHGVHGDGLQGARTFEWHSDQGAILWKAQRLATLQLGSLEPEPMHLSQLLGVKKQLRELSDLRRQEILSGRAGATPLRRRIPQAEGPLQPVLLSTAVTALRPIPPTTSSPPHYRQVTQVPLVSIHTTSRSETRYRCKRILECIRKFVGLNANKHDFWSTEVAGISNVLCVARSH
jgi:hypothetical protein